MRVILKLTIDAVRRQIGWYFFLIFSIQMQMMPHIALEIFPSADRLALSMSLAMFLLLGTAGLVNDRVLYQLPVSRRQWWQVRWTLGTVAVAACATTAVAVAAWRHTGLWPAPSTWAVHLLMTATFCGALHSGYVLWYSQWEAPVSSGRALANVFGLTTVMVIALPAVPFALAPVLPHEFPDLQGPHLLALAGLGVLAIPGLRFAPPVTPRMWAQPRPDGDQVFTGLGIARPSWFDRFTGLWQWLGLEARRQTIAMGAVLLGFLVLNALVPDPKDRSWAAHLEIFGLLPFRSPGDGEATTFVLGMVLLAAHPFAPRPWVFNLRAMRCLPHSATFLPLMPLLTAAVATGVWLMWLAVLHLVAVHAWPVTWPGALALRLAAMVTGVETLRLCIPESLAPHFAVWMVGCWTATIAPIAIHEAGWPIPSGGPSLVAATVLLASIPIAHWSITRNPRLYRRRSTAMRVG